VLRLLLGNLLANAIKYTDGGVVQLRAFVADGLVITVGDSGRGIDPADHSRIFEPFEHGERIENKTTPGLGLGLALVRDLVAALGGRLSLQSEKGSGSLFTVTLRR
jgi:signal transduction histidine kinase